MKRDPRKVSFPEIRIEIIMNGLQDFEYLKLQCEKDLPDVFGTVLDCFPNIKRPTVSGHVYLWEVLQRIKYNLLQDIDVNTFLLNKYVSGRRSSEYDRKKERLPAICYNAKFKGYKNLDNLKSISNLMFLDIDDFKSKEDALAYKTMIITKYDWIIACNLSLSKLGLHVVIMVDKIIDNKDYNNKYDYISSTFFDGKLDNSSKSLSRYTVVPYDYNIYINESPNVLDIENIIKNDKKSIRSAYIEGEDLQSLSNNKEGISSAYIEARGIGREKEEKIISTAYTFFSPSPLKEIMNVAARKDRLKFKQEVCESLFKDPNIPLYVHEGIDVISINLFPFRDTGVKEGNRNKFIGAITAQMIYLNVSPDNPDPEIREAILKFMLSINKKICDPPLTFKEVLNSCNANFKSYDAGELDVNKYFRKQKAFWSRNSTLKGNEKRKVTCKIKNKPIVAESRKKIADAIETLNAQGEKVSQKKVADVSGLRLPTVKKYRDYYNELMKIDKMNNENKCVTPEFSKEPDSQNDSIASIEIPDMQISIQNSNDSDTYRESENNMVIENPEIIDVEDDTLVMFADFWLSLTDDQIHEVYDRVFNSFKSRLDEQQKQEHYKRFVNQLNTLPQSDLKVLVINIDDINDSTTYFKQAALDSKLWDLCVDIELIPK